MALSRREKMRQELGKAVKGSQERKESGGKYKSIFKDGLELTFLKLDERQHILDIIPYFAGKNDPHVEEGQSTYVLDLWVHRGVGINEDNYVCLFKNYDLPCPICEHQAELMRTEDYDETIVDGLNPKRRVIYNVICYDTAEQEEKGVQIFEVAHFFMENNIIPISSDSRTGEPIKFADPDEGKSIAFQTKKSSFPD